MEPGIKITGNQIASLIYIIRDEKVMLDSDLANLYGVTTSRLNEQVKRNIGRFPTDFMFQLTKEEFQFLISQNATSKRGGRRKLPYAFTEHGAVMLASVLNTDIAVKASVEVVRGFVRLRELLSSSHAVARLWRVSATAASGRLLNIQIGGTPQIPTLAGRERGRGATVN